MVNSPLLTYPRVAQCAFGHRHKTNRQSSTYMSLSASYFAVPLMAVRLNYKSVTEPYVFIDHLIQNILHFRTIKKLLFMADELFLCLTFPNYTLGIFTIQFLSAPDSTTFIYKCLVTCDLLKVTEHHCC